MLFRSNDTATTEIYTRAYTLSLHDALPIYFAAIAWVRAWTLDVGYEISLTVSLAVVAIILWTSLVASVLPLIIKKVGIDPAVVSGPMITTVIDGTGLIIYFSIARMVIEQLGT